MRAALAAAALALAGCPSADPTAEPLHAVQDGSVGAWQPLEDLRMEWVPGLAP